MIYTGGKRSLFLATSSLELCSNPGGFLIEYGYFITSSLFHFFPSFKDYFSAAVLDEFWLILGLFLAHFWLILSYRERKRCLATSFSLWSFVQIQEDCLLNKATSLHKVDPVVLRLAGGCGK